MKSFHMFITVASFINSCLLFSSCQQISSNRFHQHFTIQELNYNNKQEVKEACKLFDDPIIQHQTGKISPNYLHERIIGRGRLSQYLICKSPDNIICGILQLKSRDEATELKKIATHKDYRRMGIASKLIKHAELFIPHSTEVIYLRVRNDNLKAIECYKKAGFKTIICTKITADCLATALSIMPCVDISNFSYRMSKKPDSKTS